MAVDSLSSPLASQTMQALYGAQSGGPGAVAQGGPVGGFDQALQGVSGSQETQGARPPPPPPSPEGGQGPQASQGGQPAPEVSQQFVDFLGKAQSGSLTSGEQQQFVDFLTDSGASTSGQIFDESA